MDLLMMLVVSSVFLSVIFLILLIILIAIPARPRRNYNSGRVSSDLDRIKKQINSEEEEW